MAKQATSRLRSRTTGGRPASRSGRSTTCSLGADQANRGWAKDEAFRLYSEALELVPEDAPERRREIGKRLAVVAQAAYHAIDAERLVRHSRPESEPLVRAGSLRA